MYAKYKWGCSSVVEHLPFKQGVDGSIPSTLIFFGEPCFSAESDADYFIKDVPGLWETGDDR